MAYSQFQSIQGPTDSRLEHTTLSGYQPVSRIGEVVINAFGPSRRLNTARLPRLRRICG
tara:strand:- start:30351 stop:30527 length:177 start_codon:yes stop_codon:yes gene_type:complete